MGSVGKLEVVGEISLLFVAGGRLICIPGRAGENRLADGKGGADLVELAEIKKILHQHFCGNTGNLIEVAVTLNGLQHCF